MRIVIDLQNLQINPKISGIGRYTLEFTKACIRNKKNHEILLVLNNQFPKLIETIRKEFNTLIPNENIIIGDVPSTTKLNGDNTNSKLLHESFLARLNPDIIHTCSLFEGNTTNRIKLFSPTIPTSVTLYDLIPHLNRECYLKNKIAELLYDEKLKELHRANLVLSISESARKEGINLGLDPQKIINISSGANYFFQPIPIDPNQKRIFLNKIGLSKPFIMYIGAQDPRKNFKSLIQAYAKLSSEIKNNHQLLLITNLKLKNHIRYKIFAMSQKLNPNKLVIIKSISDDDLRFFYNLCKLFIFPSYHEGFGLPVLEAMQCGAPVICSNVTSLPEIVENTNAMFDPYSIESIRNKMTEVLTNENFRQKLILNSKEQAKKFSWDLTSQRAIKAFEKLHKEINS